MPRSVRQIADASYRQIHILLLNTDLKQPLRQNGKASHHLQVTLCDVP